MQGYIPENINKSADENQGFFPAGRIIGGRTAKKTILMSLGTD
jgi:hypothetical protein